MHVHGVARARMDLPTGSDGSTPCRATRIAWDTSNWSVIKPDAVVHADARSASGRTRAPATCRARKDAPITYSIVARCAETGQLGVAIASQALAVGRLAAFAEPGVGAVVTQSVVLMAHGPRILDGLHRGMEPEAAIAASLDVDEGAPMRQLAAVDGRGTVAAFTGDRCMAHAGHTTGDGWSTQSNLAADPRVWTAMGAAYEHHEGALEERLLAALDAAEAAGGDLRGRQSAALRIVEPAPTGDLLTDVVIDVRVDDHADPLRELRRLVDLAVGFHRLEVAEQALGTGDDAAAVRLGDAVVAAHPDEVPYRSAFALLLLATGRIDRAREELARATAASGDDRWRVFLRRAGDAGLVDHDAVTAVLRQPPTD
jgi:uncharacterized Ntn-hydrolase superfamily protein